MSSAFQDDLKQRLAAESPKKFGNGFAWGAAILQVVKFALQELDILPPKAELLSLVQPQIHEFLADWDIPWIPNRIESRLDMAIEDSLLRSISILYDQLASDK